MKRAKLGKSQTLQQFSRDADEIETWTLEKLQLAEEENYKDPANIQSKHQNIKLLKLNLLPMLTEFNQSLQWVKISLTERNAVVVRGLYKTG